MTVVANFEAEKTIIQARILTRHRVRTPQGYRLRYHVLTPEGPAVFEVQDADYLCFCHQQDEMRLQQLGAVFSHSRRLALQSFSCQPVTALYFSEYSALNDVIHIAADADIPLFEPDIRPQIRYLIERNIKLDMTCQIIPAGFLGKTPKHKLPKYYVQRTKACDLSLPLKLVSFDLECSMQGELYCAGFYSDRGKTVLMVGEKPDDFTGVKDEQEQVIDCELHWFADEKSLLQGILDWFAKDDPDIIIGWSVVSFDLALLHKRSAFYGIPLTLGRGDQLLGWKVADIFRPETLELPGRVVLDGIDWLKAAFYRFDSYSLESVSQQMLGLGKAVDKVEQRGEEISQMFRQDKAELAFYNLTDCRLVWEIFEQTQLLEFALERSRMTGLELGRVGASVAAFNHLYLPRLHRDGFVAPTLPTNGGEESPGGYVMDSVPGLYQNVLVLDFKSLYPSIIRTFLIDPKGLVQGLAESVEAKQNSQVAGFKGAIFSRNAPILPDLIASLSAQREKAKQEQNAPLSQAIKIIMNSLYGVLGSSGCVFHDARLASSITMRGHEIMKQTKLWLEQTGFKVIYGDTDSTFVWVEDDSLDMAALGNKLAADINQRWQQKLADEFALESFLELEFECHYRQFFMPTLRGSELGSKKRYVGLKSSQGKDELVFKGMEQVRSDWTPLAKMVQLELFTRLFAGEDLVQYLQDVRQGLYAGEYDDLLVFSKRLRRDIKDYSAKSAPHVKAAALMVEHSGDLTFGKRGAHVSYVITTAGSQPVKYRQSSIDYQYYEEKQIESIAEPILTILALNYHTVTSSQLMLL